MIFLSYFFHDNRVTMEQKITLATVKNSFTSITSSNLKPENFEDDAFNYFFENIEELARRHPGQIPILKAIREKMTQDGIYLTKDTFPLQHFVDYLTACPRRPAENHLLDYNQKKLL